MAKPPKTQWICQECGEKFPKFLGRCSGCGAWNSLREEVSASTRQRLLTTTPPVQRDPVRAVPIGTVQTDDFPRLTSGFGEMDRVLGGGIVPGSLVLIGGDPGIGKSTLLLQVMNALGQQDNVLYITGEESAQQVKRRGERLHDLAEHLYLLAETDLDAILLELESLCPRVAVIDSIQSIFWAELTSPPGSLSQVRECTSLLMRRAKSLHISLLIVGHITKEGIIAGPKVLEHLVDTVLYFEGDRFQSYRLLRSVKNRFGASHEIGIFEMGGAGLSEVTNPSHLFMTDRQQMTSGTATIVACEGSRPLVIDLQALVSPTSYSSPRRTSTGIETNRFLQILAVLEKRLGIPLSKYDAYIATAGGMGVDEPAADLGVAIAIAASFRDRLVDPYTVLIGEVGLGGQVRPVPHLDQRLKEAVKLGFRRAVIPHGTVASVPGLELCPVHRVLEALAIALPGTASSPPPIAPED
ncbi:MAG: DNA repair protein RadA [Synechococcales cyanobacterium]